MIRDKSSQESNLFPEAAYPLKIRGEILTIGPEPWLMGILNVTPDSFSDGGKFFKTEKAQEQGLAMVEQGARIIDIGGESTRPGAREISLEEELNRVIPVVQKLRKQTSAYISIDTRKSQVARAALEEGADLINDISALRHDPDMARVVARYQVPVVLMHMLGQPENMQQAPHYDNLLFDLKYFFLSRMREASRAGITEDSLILDPGLGFGKTAGDNLRLINNLDYFLGLNRPILIGPSRKSFIGKILAAPPEDRLEGTIASAVISYLRGAVIFRVHDILQVKRALQVAKSVVKEIKVAE